MTKVLLVEDDPLISRMYLRVFMHEGLEAVLAEDGEAGLEKLKTFKPDIILLDIMMPKMNGMEMLGRIKMQPGLKDIPVIMLTNFADTHMAEGAVKQGALRYVIKSEYTPIGIVAMLRKVVVGDDAKINRKKTPGSEEDR